MILPRATTAVFALNCKRAPHHDSRAQPHSETGRAMRIPGGRARMGGCASKSCRKNAPGGPGLSCGILTRSQRPLTSGLKLKGRLCFEPYRALVSITNSPLTRSKIRCGATTPRDVGYKAPAPLPLSVVFELEVGCTYCEISTMMSDPEPGYVVKALSYVLLGFRRQREALDRAIPIALRQTPDRKNPAR
jgi:hypothetical protein